MLSRHVLRLSHRSPRPSPTLLTATGAMPGSGAQRQHALHMSAMRRADVTRGRAPAESRQQRDSPHGEQNLYLMHKSGSDNGKGNAGESLSLPSHKVGIAKSGPSPSQARAFSTSAPRVADKHTAESYFKDIDDQPPVSDKTHQVDGSVTGGQVHSPTGEFNRAGPQTPEYESVSKEEPYDASAGSESNKKLRYGGTDRMKASESGDGGGDSVSKPNDGPEGASKGGRKPEGRT